jgi:type I restriction enzyme, S subunit
MDISATKCTGGGTAKLKPSGIEWLGNIPSHWGFVAIKRIVATKITDGPHETPELADEGIPFISAEAIKKNKIDFGLRRGNISRELHEQYCRKCNPQRNDIFIIKSGATTGNVACVDVDYEFSIWSPLALVRCNEHVVFYRFLFYVLLSDVFKKQVELSWSFGTQENIGMGVLGRIRTTVPPLRTQRCIAAYLDRACKAIEGAIGAKQKQLDSLVDLRKSIIHSAVTRGLNDSVDMKPSGVDWLGEIPVHWNAPRLKDIADIRYGLGQPPAESDDGIPMIRATNVNAGRIVDRDLLCIDVDDLPLARNPYLKAHEIIVVRSGAYTGDSAIIPPEYAGAVAGYDMVVTVRKAVPEFVAYTLLSYYVLNAQILLLTLRAAQPHLNAEQLGSVRLLVPDSRDEQKAIAAHIAHKLAGVDRVHKSLRDQIQALSDYRKSLIHECVTGKKRITEADIKKVEDHV